MNENNYINLNIEDHIKKHIEFLDYLNINEYLVNASKIPLERFENKII